MPTATTARSVSDFNRFAKEGQSNLRLEKKIAVFLAQLVDVRSPDRVKSALGTAAIRAERDLFTVINAQPSYEIP